MGVTGKIAKKLGQTIMGTAKTIKKAANPTGGTKFNSPFYERVNSPATAAIKKDARKAVKKSNTVGDWKGVAGLAAGAAISNMAVKKAKEQQLTANKKKVAANKKKVALNKKMVMAAKKK